MNKKVAHCNNENCEEYQEDACRRAIAHKKVVALPISETYQMSITYITERNNVTACELHLPEDL